jgi:protein-disulfide isomerase
MQSRLEAGLSVILTVAAVVIAGVLVRREFFVDGARSVPGIATEKPAREPRWAQLQTASIPVGDSVAPVTIVAFTDFECPACRSFHQRLAAVRRDLPGSASLRMIHYPLDNHRFARPAARAASCAARQGRLAAMYDLLFEKQDSLGLKSWSAFAADAGVADTMAFLRCNKSNDAVPEVEQGRSLGKELMIAGTPTLIINGWRFSSPPDEAELKRVIVSLQSGREPF